MTTGECTHSRTETHTPPLPPYSSSPPRAATPSNYHPSIRSTHCRAVSCHSGVPDLPCTLDAGANCRCAGLVTDYQQTVRAAHARSLLWQPMRTLLHTHCQRSNTSEIAELCCDCAASAWCTDATEELCVTLRLQRLLTRSSGMMD